MGAASPAPAGLRFIRAPNASPLTLDGTRTYIVGRRRPAILDPGPALAPHLAALAAAVADAGSATILVTHNHPDHAPGAAWLAAHLGAPVRAASAGSLRPGDVVETDAGRLVAVATPGHAADHLAFHWPAADAVFCGDLMLGGQDTALVAPPGGDLTEYLASLERLRALRPALIYPTHGEPFTDADAAIARYLRHRQERQAQMLSALAPGAATADLVMGRVYGAGLDPRLRAAAAGATLTYLQHLERVGRVRRLEGGRWTLA
jgi:glyoxylase-like metal-dependent hydrolase (beta-lactamase superfamily II)